MHACSTCTKKYPKCSPSHFQFHAKDGKLVVSRCSDHTPPPVEGKSLFIPKILVIAGLFLISLSIYLCYIL